MRAPWLNAITRLWRSGASFNSRWEQEGSDHSINSGGLCIALKTPFQWDEVLHGEAEHFQLLWSLTSPKAEHPRRVQGSFLSSSWNQTGALKGAQQVQAPKCNNWNSWLNCESDKINHILMIQKFKDFYRIVWVKRDLNHHLIQPPSWAGTSSTTDRTKHTQFWFKFCSFFYEAS